MKSRELPKPFGVTSSFEELRLSITDEGRGLSVTDVRATMELWLQTILEAKMVA